MRSRTGVSAAPGSRTDFGRLPRCRAHPLRSLPRLFHEALVTEAGLPGNQFYVTGGTMKPDADSYVVRKADSELLRAALAGEFCYVLTPRQMGKSSMMTRTARSLADANVQIG